MNIGDSVRVRDIKVNGVEFLDAPNNIITAVKTTRVVVEEVKPEAAAAAAVPGAAATPGAPGAAPAAAAPAAGAAPAKPAGKEEKKK